MSGRTELSAVPASTETFILGEGPMWDAPRQTVMWVDIEAGAVLTGRMAGDRVEITARREFGETVGAVSMSAGGDMLVAARRSLLVLGSDGSRVAEVPILPEQRMGRLNDGKPDPLGRFLVGSLALEGESSSELLVRLEDDGSLEQIDLDLHLSNGLGWSPDGSTMYSIDTGTSMIWSRAYDPPSGAFGDRRALARLDGESPDGMAVDADGNLWVALYGAGEVRCLTPAGAQVGRVRVDAPDTTSCCFVGQDLDRLLITTAEGPLFLVDVGVRGTPVSAWRGLG